MASNDSNAEMTLNPDDKGNRKEIIFMIHGMWGGPWYWHRYVSYFHKLGYDCVTPTLRFHSTPLTKDQEKQLGNTSLLDYAAALEKEIRELPQIPIIMGHSMGGLLAQMLASRGLASKLVLLTPAAPSCIWALTCSVIRSFSGVMFKWRFWNKPISLSYKKAVYSILEEVPELQRKITYGNFVPESGRAAFETGFWFLDFKHASRVDESKVTCPTLVVAGTKDRITPACVVRKVFLKYKKVSTYVEFSNHAHWVIEEPGWEDITKCIASWLD